MTWLGELGALLRGIPSGGGFCVGGEHPAQMPQLVVEGVGEVSLPLFEPQAKALIEAARRAPYGKGMETVVDTQVRRTWELSPPALKVSGAGWEAALREITALARARLGVDGEVEAELYKGLLYERGDFFSMHRDTEKAPGMFGTLVIVLPSIFVGGELVVEHAGDVVALPLQGSSIVQVAWGAFYTDCQHELRPIKAGYRLCLIYNLISRQERRPPLPSATPLVEEARALLRRWSALGDAGHEKVAYVLEHFYSMEGLSPPLLKGRDQAAAGALSAAATAEGFSLHIAHLSAERDLEMIYRGGDWEWDEDSSEEYKEGEELSLMVTLRGWVALGEGVTPEGELRCEEHELCPAMVWGELKPDEVHLNEFSGNEGGSIEHVYWRTALVLWPQRAQARVLLSRGEGELAAGLRGLLSAQAPAARVRALLEEALSRVPAQPRWGVDGWRLSLRGALLSGCVRLEDAALSRRCLEHMFLRDAPTVGEVAGVLALLEALPSEERRGFLLALAPQSARALPQLVELLVGVVAQAREEEGLVTARAFAEALIARLGEFPKPTAALVVSLVSALLAEGLEAQLEGAVATILAHDATFGVEGVLLDAALGLRGALSEEALRRPALEVLRLQCVACVQGLLQGPLAAPVDWSKEATACPCKDCAEVSRFLRDPVARAWGFTASEPRRRHVQGQIASMRDITSEVIRGGSPLTLMLSKRHQRFEDEAARRARLTRALERLGAAPL